MLVTSPPVLAFEVAEKPRVRGYLALPLNAAAQHSTPLRAVTSAVPHDMTSSAEAGPPTLKASGNF